MPVPVWFNVSRDQTPNSGVGVLSSYAMVVSKRRHGIWSRFGPTPWEQIEVTVPKEVFRGLGVLLPDGVLLDLYNASSAPLACDILDRYITWVPTFPLDLHELDRQQVLIDVDDLWDDNRHGEILLDQTFVQVQGRLDKLLIIVPIVPNIELAVKGVSLLRVLLLL